MVPMDKRMQELDRRRLLATLGLGGGLALAGCLDSQLLSGGTAAAQPVTAPDERPETNDDRIAAYTRENAGFGLDLLQALAAEESDTNLLVSPLSASVALAIAWGGARGDTADEMQETLRYPHDQDDLHPTIGALQYDLNEVATEDVDGTFDLALANALWGQESYPFRESYLDTAEENYGGAFREVDFVDETEESRERINEWVAERTQDNIDELLPPGSITGLTRLVITNAVYLLADWKYPFDPEDTDDGEFTQVDGSTAEVPMMQQTETFRHLSDHDHGYQMIDLPYVGDAVSMSIILPEEGTFESFVADMTGEWLIERFAELDQADESELRLELPRFEFESSTELGELLADLGMPSAFDDQQANFEGIARLHEISETLFIHEVYHDTFVSVDEEGTEAAAATGVVMGDDSAPPSMTVDRPFIFTIRDRKSDAVLFLGRVVDAADMA